MLKVEQLLLLRLWRREGILIRKTPVLTMPSFKDKKFLRGRYKIKEFSITTFCFLLPPQIIHPMDEDD
jgi:hypothetical protein